MEFTKSTKLRKLEKAVDFRYWFQTILKLWWVFVLTGLLMGIAGFIYAYVTPVKYRSNLTFALDDGSKGSGSIVNLASELGLNIGSGSNVFSGDNIFAILKSRRIVESVLLTTDTFSTGAATYIEKYLTANEFFKDDDRKHLHFPAGIKREKLSYQQDSLLKKVYGDFSKNLITVDRPEKKLSIYLLQVKTPNEELTKKFTDELMQQSNNFYTDLLTQKSRQTLETLEQQAAEMKRNLLASISGKASVQDANLNPAFSKAQIPVLREQTNMQVYGAAYAEIFKNLEVARFQYLNARPILQIIDDASYPMDKVKKSKLLYAVGFAVAGCLAIFLFLWVGRVFFIIQNAG